MGPTPIQSGAGNNVNEAPRSPELGPHNKMQFSAIKSHPFFEALVPLQGIQLEYSKPRRQSESKVITENGT